MRSGAPTTRASSCSAIGATAYPLTVTDFASRYLLTCEALATTQEKFAFTVFERTFKEFAGLPHAIRTDNGVPLAVGSRPLRLEQTGGLGWLRLGIAIERIQPGPSATERSPRADAPDPEEGRHQTRPSPAAFGAQGESELRLRRAELGVTQVGERIWLVTFMRYDLGDFDDQTCRLEPIENPFTPKVLPMSSE